MFDMAFNLTRSYAFAKRAINIFTLNAGVFELNGKCGEKRNMEISPFTTILTRRMSTYLPIMENIVGKTPVLHF